MTKILFWTRREAKYCAEVDAIWAWSQMIHEHHVPVRELDLAEIRAVIENVYLRFTAGAGKKEVSTTV